MQPKFVIYELNEIPPLSLIMLRSVIHTQLLLKLSGVGPSFAQKLSIAVYCRRSLGRRYTEGFRTSNIP